LIGTVIAYAGVAVFIGGGIYHIQNWEESKERSGIVETDDDIGGGVMGVGIATWVGGLAVIMSPMFTKDKDKEGRCI